MLKLDVAWRITVAWKFRPAARVFKLDYRIKRLTCHTQVSSDCLRGAALIAVWIIDARARSCYLRGPGESVTRLTRLHSDSTSRPSCGCRGALGNKQHTVTRRRGFVGCYRTKSASMKLWARAFRCSHCDELFNQLEQQRQQRGGECSQRQQSIALHRSLRYGITNVICISYFIIYNLSADRDHRFTFMRLELKLDWIGRSQSTGDSN